MIPSLVCNFLILVCTALTVAHGIKKAGAGPLMRYFTVLSNCVSALAALLVIVFRIAGGVPNGVLVFKHIASAAVGVTMLVTVGYLWPVLKDFKGLFGGINLYLHVLGPILAIVSLLLWDKPAGGFGIVLLGTLPVVVYGSYYMYRVLKAPQEKRWEDFYRFNTGGLWAVSFAAVTLLNFLISLGCWAV